MPNIHLEIPTVVEVVKEDRRKNLKKLIFQLKHQLTEDELSYCASCDDEFFARFIRGRKYDLERAHSSLQRFLNIIMSNHELMRGLSPSKFKTFYETEQATVLKNRDRNGRQIFVLRTRIWNPDEIDLFTGLVSDYLVIEQMITSLETQRNGISVIFDLEGFSLHQARQMTPKIARVLCDMAQGSLPVSFQEIHFVNNPAVFNMLYAIARPFLHEKLRKRFNFHGQDLTSLHAYLSPDILPKCLGGNLSEKDAWDQTIIKNLLARDDFYKKLFK